MWGEVGTTFSLQTQTEPERQWAHSESATPLPDNVFVDDGASQPMEPVDSHIHRNPKRQVGSKSSERPVGTLPPRTVKFLLTGDPGAGKTAFWRRLTENSFGTSFIATVGTRAVRVQTREVSARDLGHRGAREVPSRLQPILPWR